TDEAGLGARISDHFGSAPAFALIAAPGSEPEFRVMPTQQGGGCGGWRTLELGEGDVVACRHIGSGALSALQGAGARVLQTTETELAGVLRALAQDRLRPFELEEVHHCGGKHS